MENIWQDLGKHFINQDQIIIAQIDMTANHMENVKVAGFPSFRLYRAGAEFDFTGPRELQNFIKFVTTESEVERKEEL